MTTIWGCRSTESEPEPRITLADLRPTGQRQPQIGLQGNMVLDIHVFHVPAHRIPNLRDLWKPTKTRGLRYRSRNAFRANALRAGLTRTTRWNWIEGVLQEARAQKERTVSMLIGSQESSDLVVRPVEHFTQISFINTEQEEETVRLRPGNLVFRWQVLPQADGSHRLLGIPALALSISTRIPELAERMRAQETRFEAAAFSAPLQPGDVLILGPEDFYGDESTLGGLLFEESEDIVFIDRIQPDIPHAEPAIRLYVIVCNQVINPGS